jgi:anti-anti-sigma factor
MIQHAPERERRQTVQLLELDWLTVASAREGDVHTITLAGELDVAAAGRVQHEIQRVEAPDALSIVVDLSGLTFIESTGVRLLIPAQLVCRRAATACWCGAGRRRSRASSSSAASTTYCHARADGHSAPAAVAGSSPRAQQVQRMYARGGASPPAAGSLPRAQEMALLREEGRSLDEIALRFAVSRERVRQILHAHGGPDSRHVADARRRRAEQQAQAHVEELLELWRTGADPRSLASSLNLRPQACRSAIARYATDVDRTARRASLASGRAVAKTYSDGDIAAALRSTAAGLGRVPSAKEYEALARTHRGPSLATVLNRMGGWSNAVRAAGLTPASPPTRTRNRSRRWTPEACWTAIRRVVAELEQVPTVITYDRHAADRPDLPSSATLRNRLGRWSAITTQLAAERGRDGASAGRDSRSATAGDRHDGR